MDADRRERNLYRVAVVLSIAYVVLQGASLLLPGMWKLGASVAGSACLLAAVVAGLVSLRLLDVQAPHGQRWTSLTHGAWEPAGAPGELPSATRRTPGIWTPSDDGRSLFCDDFELDARLDLDADVESDEQRLRLAWELCDRLNAGQRQGGT